MRAISFWMAVSLVSAGAAGARSETESNLLSNGGFEDGFKGWSRWGANAELVTLEQRAAYSGTNAARIQHAKNALYFSTPLSPGQAYELTFFYRLEGENLSGQTALGYRKQGGALNSAGREIFKLTPPSGKVAGQWAEFRKTFLPNSQAVACQFTFTADAGATLWLDDVSLRKVARPAGLAEPPDPWAGLKRRTPNPLFRELLSDTPGHYTVVCWAHDLNPTDDLVAALGATKDAAKLEREVRAIFREAGEAGMGFLDLPGRLDGRASWRTPEFHREQFRTCGVRFDVWTEGSGSVAAALKNGAELLNPAARALGRRPSVSLVDPKYVEAQERILRELGRQLRGEPFVGYYYGKDEPSIHLPEGSPDRWGNYGQTMAREVLEKYGFDRFRVPLPNDKEFQQDPLRPLRWIAYNRWMNEKFIESRCRLRAALREADPAARYSPADYWFMSGFVPYDHARLAACSDLMELDPYASSAEQRRGRGVFNHGFGAKFMNDLTGKPVRIVAQAFDYAGYDMTPDDLREWVSQAMRCGAAAIDYYEMDRPRWTHSDRWQMMLHLSKTITRMNRLRPPDDSDTAVLYTLYTHMSHGAHTSGDQAYAAHVLLGELAGSWFRFISDAQLERREQNLDACKVVYLPLAQYMTPEATQQIEDYVRAGGTLVCGDAEAFAFDLAGNDTSTARERILGIKTIGAKTAEEIVLKSAGFGLAAGSRLRLFEIKLHDGTSVGRARAIQLADPQAEVLGSYPDCSPALVSHRLGKGRALTFAANPFAPQVAVDASLWPAAFKGLQQSLGCKVDQPIWRFLVPPPSPESPRSARPPGRTERFPPPGS